MEKDKNEVTSSIQVPISQLPIKGSPAAKTQLTVDYSRKRSQTKVFSKEVLNQAADSQGLEAKFPFALQFLVFSLLSISLVELGRWNGII